MTSAWKRIPTVLMLFAVSTQASAHVSEQGLVLLLPTTFYISSGVAAVALTIVAVALLPEQFLSLYFSRTNRIKKANHQPRAYVGLISLLVIVVLLFLGWFGPTDPTKNLLPLTIWTLWWIGFTVLHVFFGNIWGALNPWQALANRARQNKITFPDWIGCWPALILFFLFICFALAHPSPDNPRLLATVVLSYVVFNMLGIRLFGLHEWLPRVECFSVLFTLYAQLSPFKHHQDQIQSGAPGWRAYHNPATSVSSTAFIIVLLGTGSFDGLNETFWWLNQIGVNPLAFPGRSAIITETVLGLIGANLILIVIYASCVALGVIWANRFTTKSPANNEQKKAPMLTSIVQLSISLLPIAMAYHFAHFLTAFMVNSQYALAALSDPMNSGQDFLKLGTFYVTTGFMNSHHTVEAIWLTQALVVVLGHILSVVLAHGIALRLHASNRAAMISQIPLATFMVFYTFLGLWLLASPRGA